MESSDRVAERDLIQIEDLALLRLLEIGPELLVKRGLPELARGALEAAIAISGAASGDLQLCDGEEGSLARVAQQGFQPASLDHFEWARRATSEACRQALESGERVIVADVLQSPLFRESPDGLALLAAGVRALQVTPLLARGGKPLGVLTTCWMTPHDPPPAKLRALDLLARQVSELIQHRRAEQELERAQAALRDSRQRAEAFVGMLGYELREPLSPILTSLEIMDLRGSDAFREERQIIRRQVQHLVRLTEDLQEAARSALGHVELRREPRALAGLLTKARDRVAATLEQHNHQLCVSVGPGLVVNADPARLVQVFVSLLLYASKQAPRAGQIQLQAQRIGSSVCISIGAGARAAGAELRGRSIEPAQPAALERAPDKGGLAMTIVHSLLRMHGGSIEVRTLEGTNEILVSLPASDERPRESSPNCQTPQQQCRKSGSRRVLVVEDNPDAAQLLANALTLLGYSVEIAPDGPSALSQLQRFSPEIALVDIGLPVMGGYELARRIRAQGHSTLRLLAVTGFGEREDRRRSAEVGFEAHLVKPVDIGALEGAIEGSLVTSD